MGHSHVDAATRAKVARWSGLVSILASLISRARAGRSACGILEHAEERTDAFKTR